VSHVVTIKTEVRDAEAVRAACKRLDLRIPASVGPVKLFNATAHGLAVQLPKWKYPVVCDVATGQVRFDNFNGRWGDPAQLDLFMQAYAVEKARIEARRKGHTVVEQPLPDGSIKLVIHVGA
jgi:hypothetical protein